MPKSKRRKSFVDSKIQGALVRRLVLYGSVFVIVTCGVTLVVQFLADPLQSSSDFGYQLRVTVGSFLAVSLCLIPAFLVDSIKLSNRFVGPILRLQSQIREVGRAEVKPMKLRKGDFWQSLSDDFNEMLERLPDHPVGGMEDGEEVRETVQSGAQ